jgi:hypothetical protein
MNRRTKWILIVAVIAAAIAAVAWGFRERRELFEGDDDERAESRERENLMKEPGKGFAVPPVAADAGH